MSTDAKLTLFKLSTGEEVVAQATFKGDVVVMKNAGHVLPVPTERGLSVQMIPFMAGCDGNEITVIRSACIVIAEPSANLYNLYQQVMGKGIQVPAEKKIILN